MHNKYINIISITFILALIINGCVAIIEPDISGEKVILLAPADGIKTFYSTQTFWWDEVINADQYQLQVVTPDFERIERLILDTTISVNKFSMSLYPSQFQWRVRALNYSYESNFSTAEFLIDSTVDLTNQAVVLINPPDNDTTNEATINFSWEKLYNANIYVFQLSQFSEIIFEDTLTESQITKSDLVDGNYLWSVKALNELSSTRYFSRSMHIMTYIPEPPELLKPANGTMFGNTDNIQFEWQRDDQVFSSLTDRLLVSSDSTFTQILIDKECINPYFESQLDQNIYYWKVKSTDKAGNSSNFSQTWKFTVYNVKKKL